VSAATAAATAARLSLNDVSRACFEAGAALCTLGPVLPQPPRYAWRGNYEEGIIILNDCTQKKQNSQKKIIPASYIFSKQCLQNYAKHFCLNHLFYRV
jgi:hypothetical protein